MIARLRPLALFAIVLALFVYANANDDAEKHRPGMASKETRFKEVSEKLRPVNRNQKETVRLQKASEDRWNREPVRVDAAQSGLLGTSFRTFGYYDSTSGAAVEDEVWTFDHGAPDTLEGWKPRNVLNNPYAAFRWVDLSTWNAHNTGADPIISGSASLWMGLFEDQADSCGWPGSMGYANLWSQRAFSPKTAVTGAGTVAYDFYMAYDTEACCDGGNVQVYSLPAGGGPFTDFAVHNFWGTNPLAFFSGSITAAAGDSVGVIITYYSDLAYSDEDGLYDSGRSVSLDNFSFFSGPLSAFPLYNFESGLQGWTTAAIPFGPDLVGIADAEDPNYSMPYECTNGGVFDPPLQGNVVEFHDDSFEHPPPRIDWIESPSIAVPQVGSLSNVFLEFDRYWDMPSAEGVFFDLYVSYYPTVIDSHTSCHTGEFTQWSEPRTDWWLWFTGTPTCFPTRFFPNDPTYNLNTNLPDYPYLVPAHAESIRVSIMVGQTWAGVGNFSPLFDNIQVGFSDKSTMLHVPSPQYTNIQAGINAADPGDTVLVRSGITYSGAGNTELDFGGKDIVLLSEKGWSYTTINCGDTVRAMIFENGETNAAVVEGFRFERGKSSATEGAVLQITNSSPVFKNCYMGDTNAPSARGMVDIQGASSPQFESVKIQLNTGRGVYISTTGMPGPRFESCGFYANDAGSLDGGGAYVDGPALFDRCLLWYNEAANGGGAYVVGADAEFDSCFVAANDVTGSGGGVYCSAATDMIGCEITGNYAAGSGGGVHLTGSGSSALIDNCTVAGNFALNGGGGLATGGPGTQTFNVQESILWGNDMTNNGGETALIGSGGVLNIDCSVVDSSGVAGAGTISYDANTVFFDPLFCVPGSPADAPTNVGDYRIPANSPATSSNSLCGQRIGSEGVTNYCTQGQGNQITAITDVPADTGGEVQIDWNAMQWDTAGAPDAVAEYSVWRKQLGGASAMQPGIPGDDIPMLIPTATGWDSVGVVAATTASTYGTTVSTTCDSTIGDPCATILFVRAHTASGSYFDSKPDSGYSRENIPPADPAGFSVQYNAPGGTQLDWDDSTDPDFAEYNVYRGENGTTKTAAVTLVHTTTTSSWLDPIPEGWQYTWEISVVDSSNNESTITAPSEVTGTEPPVTPRRYALHQNVPNPFNPTTVIRYDVPASGGHVSLQIYDVSGRLVRMLVDGVEQPGEKRVTWDGMSDAGQQVATGVYFYKMVAPSYTMSRKMVLMK